MTEHFLRESLLRRVVATLSLPLPEATWEAALRPLSLAVVRLPDGRVGPFAEPFQDPTEAVVRLFFIPEHANEYRYWAKGSGFHDISINEVDLEGAFEYCAKFDEQFRKTRLGPLRLDLSIMQNRRPHTLDTLFTAFVERH